MSDVKRQPRGEAKREQVLDATIRLVAREGPGAVTLRAVAAEAGTSLRGATYYFASRDELLTEAFLHYTRRAIERFEAISAQAPPPGKGTRSVAAAMLADTVLVDVLGDRPGLVAEYELVLEIGRNPVLESAYARWQDALLAMLASHARALGSPRPKRHARIVLATLRGLEIEALARPSTPPTREDLRKVFYALLGGLRKRKRRQD